MLCMINKNGGRERVRDEEREREHEMNKDTR